MSSWYAPAGTAVGQSIAVEEIDTWARFRALAGEVESVSRPEGAAAARFQVLVTQRRGPDTACAVTRSRVVLPPEGR